MYRILFFIKTVIKIQTVQTLALSIVEVIADWTKNYNTGIKNYSARKLEGSSNYLLHTCQVEDNIVRITGNAVHMYSRLITKYIYEVFDYDPEAKWGLVISLRRPIV